MEIIKINSPFVASLHFGFAKFDRVERFLGDVLHL